MKTLAKSLAALLLVLAASPLGAPLAAQSGSRSAHTAAAPSQAVNDVRVLWQIASDFVVAAAEQMPDSAYAFKPTPEVRSFGEIVAHVASSQRLLCGMVLGDTPAEAKGTTKADLVAALKESNAYCAKAYAISDADALRPLNAASQRLWISTGLGTPRSRFYALATNAWHDNEHYGNVVTYMRLRGMVPPSSQPRK